MEQLEANILEDGDIVTRFFSIILYLTFVFIFFTLIYSLCLNKYRRYAPLPVIYPPPSLDDLPRPL
jgi:hypothetical protein